MRTGRTTHCSTTPISPAQSPISSATQLARVLQEFTNSFSHQLQILGLFFETAKLSSTKVERPQANSSPSQICLLEILQDLSLYFSLPNSFKSCFLDVLKLNSRLRNQSTKTNHKGLQLCHVLSFPIQFFFLFSLFSSGFSRRCDF